MLEMLLCLALCFLVISKAHKQEAKSERNLTTNKSNFGFYKPKKKNWWTTFSIDVMKKLSWHGLDDTVHGPLFPNQGTRINSFFFFFWMD